MCKSLILGLSLMGFLFLMATFTNAEASNPKILMKTSKGDITIELYPDNIMYETDFPHPTSMAVGPKSIADHPSSYAERVLGSRPDAVLAKILHDTAAKVYHLI